jgi:hypothetical protein
MSGALMDFIASTILLLMPRMFRINESSPFQALTAPIMIPFTKYFCRNGKKNITGSMVTIIVAF